MGNEPPSFSEVDRRFMRRALDLAEQGRGRTAPNPMVGAVVVREASGEPQVVGEGFHPRAGEPHAEVFALREAGERARGATVYVTLEPCCHFGRTPPCTEALLKAGVRQVVAAMQDPFPRVAGGGLAQLRAEGLQVECGLLEDEARELNRAYLKAVISGGAWVTLKMATTLDGKIATRTGDSRWVTGEVARQQVHRLRDEHDAVLVGIGTARADDPQLTARIEGARNPVRVVVDARADLSPESCLARTAHAVPTLLLTGEGVVQPTLASLGIEIISVPTVAGRIELAAALKALVDRGIHSVLCEGGAGIAGSLLDQNLVDEVWWFLAPKLAGGVDAPSALGGEGPERMAEAHQLERVTLHQYGPDLALHGYLARP